MVTTVLVLLVLVALVVLVPLLVVIGLAAFGIHLVRRPFRERRRPAQRRRQWERAEHARLPRLEAKARRRATIRARTGLDTELLGEFVRDVGQGAGDQVRRSGEWITRTLEARRARTAGAAESRDGKPAADQWLDLDTDLGSLQSRARTAEMLRLSDQLWARAESSATSSR